MNTVELSESFIGKAKWTHFAEKLKKAMVDDFKLDGVAVFLREMTQEEKDGDESNVLAFNHQHQRFEFAVSPDDPAPTAWKVADRIDHFLNP
jgi:hypothetical protein